MRREQSISNRRLGGIVLEFSVGMRAVFRMNLIVSLIFVLFGCEQGKRPFLMVQMCVQNTAGAAQLVNELRAVAFSERMKFTDNSMETKRGLDTIGHPTRPIADGSVFINVGVFRDDGMGIGATNLGLPGYQVAVGFSAGADESEARHFADNVIKRLEQHWRVDTVPPGSGVRPMPDCK